MKTPYTIPAVIFGLLVPVALVTGAWNLMAPAAWCWLPAGRAFWCAAFALVILVLACHQATKEETAQNAPRNARRASGGNLPADAPQGVREVPANARRKP